MIIWTCMNLSLFELYLKFMTMMYFILFYLNLWLNIYFLNNFVNTRGYSWIPANMKKIDGYPHNGYPTDRDTGTGQIFIQRVGYGEATTRSLPAPLTSLAGSILALIVVDQVHVLVSFLIIIFSCDLVGNSYGRERCMVYIYSCCFFLFFFLLCFLFLYLGWGNPIALINIFVIVDKKNLWFRVKLSWWQEEFPQ